MQHRPDTELVFARKGRFGQTVPRAGRAVPFTGFAIALFVLVGAGLGAGDGAAQQVTIQLGQYRNANGVLVMVFSGTVASGAAGEIVDVVGQDCGTRGFRLIASARSQAGGSWHAENPRQDFPWSYTPVHSGITFKARWRDAFSAPVVYRSAAPLSVKRIQGRRAWRVHTSPPPPGTGSMKGKIVELQRRAGGSWTTIQRSRLVMRPRLQDGALNHEAVFTVVRRGWTLRAVLPARSASPCYLPAVSSTWRS